MTWVRLWVPPRRARRGKDARSESLRQRSRSRFLADPERYAMELEIYGALKTGLIGNWHGVLIIEGRKP